MARRSSRSESRCSRLDGLFTDRKPSNVKREQSIPLTATAVARAVGPGTATTSTPRLRQTSTSTLPGSEMAGIPASVARAQSSPARSLSAIVSARSNLLCS